MRLATAVEHASPVARGDTGVTREARAEAAANRAAFNDLGVPAHGASLARLRAAGVDARLAAHVARLLERDPLVSFRCHPPPRPIPRLPRPAPPRPPHRSAAPRPRHRKPPRRPRPPPSYYSDTPHPSPRTNRTRRIFRAARAAPNRARGERGGAATRAGRGGAGIAGRAGASTTSWPCRCAALPAAVPPPPLTRAIVRRAPCGRRSG